MIPVAEHTIALMLGAAKKFYPISQRLRGASPDWANAKSFQAIELYGKTLALIGIGRIGKRVASIANAMDMNVIAYDPYVNPNNVPEFAEPKPCLEDILVNQYFVSLHVMATEATRNLISAREFALMKPTAIIMNVSRGMCINEQDMIEALQNHVIAGAALDVFADEPLKDNNPLMLMENVLATPHNAASTPDAHLRSQQICAQNIIDFFAGKSIPTALNKIGN